MENTIVNISANRKILYSLIFLSFLISMRLWLGWEGRSMYINAISFAISFFVICFSDIKFVFSKRNIVFFLLLVIANFITKTDFGAIFLSFVVIFLNGSDKMRCLDFITKWYGYLMLPSLLIYLLYFFIDLPYFGIQSASDSVWASKTGYGICKNLIFYMRSSFEGYAYRFNGPFLEPGHLGMISAFLLFVNHFDFNKKGMKLILISIFFTLSLAGYVLLFIGFVFILYFNNKIKLTNLIFYSFAFLLIYLSALFYNDGDNFLNNFIFSRLELDEESGIVGNNRVFGLMDYYFIKMWDDPSLLLFGYSQDFIEWLAEHGSRGTGYIMFVCRYGLIGLSSVIVMYGYYFLTSTNKKFSILMLIFVSLMFWQRSYPFWIAWILCYVYGINKVESSNKHLYESRNSNLPSQP